MHRVSWFLTASLLLLAFLVAPLQAQVIRGQLKDADTDQPISGGTVSLLDARERVVLRVISDDGGAFVLNPRTAGRYSIRAERIGYRAATTPPLDLQGRDTLAVEVHLSTQAVLLAPLTVTVAPRQNVRDRTLDGFYHRQRRARGAFFGPADLERLRPGYASNLLQQVPGVRTPFGRGTTAHVYMINHRGDMCVPTLILDGQRIRLDAELTIDDLVPASSVRAVEVYRSPFAVPGEFGGVVNWDCGVVVVWTTMGIMR